MDNKKHIIVFRKTQGILTTMGEQIRLARLRRKLSAKLIAERAGISRATLWKIEKGDSTVAIGAYAKVLAAIGLLDDLLLVAKDDALGHLLENSRLNEKWRRGDE